MTVTVELFGAPGCSHCASARKTLQSIVQGLDDDRLTWRAVDIIDEIDYAVALGIVSTPAIAIDGELIFTALPGPKKLTLEVEKRLAAEVRPS